MVWKIYMIILGYYIAGTAGIWFINRRKEPSARRKAWIKHITYFLISTAVFFSIGIDPVVFRVVAILIVAAGLYEIFKLCRQSGFRHPGRFIVSEVIFMLFSAGFIFFSRMDMGLMLYTFVIVCIFDGFSQIAGQLFGKRKLFRRISPNKTVEGLIGGMVVAVLSALLFKNLVDETPLRAVILAGVVSFFAFAGDALKSYYKRIYCVKDFSNLVPGHGGILDRFDSLIAAGAGVALFVILSGL